MRPRIVVLESIHERGLDMLSVFANVVYRPGLDRPDQLRQIAEADAVVVKSVIKVDDELLRHAPRLQVVARAGTGLDNIDLDVAQARGVVVLSTPGANAVSAAEFTVALILGLCRRLPGIFDAVRNRDFRRNCFEGRELAQLTVGLVGLGRVGMAVAERLKPFGCQLLGHEPDPVRANAFQSLGGRVVAGLPNLAEQVDVLSVHVALTAATRRLIGREIFGRLRPGAFLVNTSRGEVVDDTALLAALEDGRVAGAALDVIYPEPPYDAAPGAHDFRHPLLDHPRVWITPHLAASTVDCQQQIAIEIASQVRAAFAVDREAM